MKSELKPPATIIRRFADRAFRRPAKDEEIDRLMKLWSMSDNDGEPFERSIQLALEAVLVSPHFLFRVESRSGRRTRASGHWIDYELATRLSYFLWSSMPDDELFALCQTGHAAQGRPSRSPSPPDAQGPEVAGTGR